MGKRIDWLKRLFKTKKKEAAHVPSPDVIAPVQMIVENPVILPTSASTSRQVEQPKQPSDKKSRPKMPPLQLKLPKDLKFLDRTTIENLKKFGFDRDVMRDAALIEPKLETEAHELEVSEEEVISPPPEFADVSEEIILPPPSEFADVSEEIILPPPPESSDKSNLIPECADSLERHSNHIELGGLSTIVAEDTKVAEDTNRVADAECHLDDSGYVSPDLLEKDDSVIPNKVFSTPKNWKEWRDYLYQEDIKSDTSLQKWSHKPFTRSTSALRFDARFSLVKSFFENDVKGTSSVTREKFLGKTPEEGVRAFYTKGTEEEFLVALKKYTQKCVRTSGPSSYVSDLTSPIQANGAKKTTVLCQ